MPPRGKSDLPGSAASQIIRFGSFEVDLRTGELRRNGLAVRLQGQPFQILVMLLERPGELVTREDIRRRLWADDTFVDFEHSLNAAIKRLREALGESAENPIFIETLPRRGYRFRVPVQNARIITSTSQVGPRPRTTYWYKYSIYVAGLLAVLTVSYMATRQWRKFSFATSHAAMLPMRVIPFTTTPGAEFDPAFSPDGKEIAFVWDQEQSDSADVYVKLIGGEQPLRITQRAGWVCNPAWSPDAHYLAFQSVKDPVGTYIVPALGGAERRLSTQAACHGLAWSRDGKFLAFPVKDSPAKRWQISLLSLETMEERRITFPPTDIIGDHQPCISPDSRAVAFTRLSSPGVTDIYVVGIEGGEPRQLTFDRTVTRGCAWAGDGKSLIVTSGRGGDVSLWRVPVAGGSPERVSVASSSAFDPAISLQGDKLAYRVGALHNSIWRLDLDAQGHATGPGHPLMKASVEDAGPQFSPDGSRIAFDSGRSGSAEIWIARADGSEPFQLTSLNVLSGSPRWSPDGKYIAFDSRPGDHSEIFVIPSVGGSPRQLTHEDVEASVPTWSRDGKWIYFTSNRLGVWQLFKVAAQGGEPIQVTSNGGFIGFESPDRTMLYYSKDNDYGIWRMPVPTGAEERILPLNLDWGQWALTPHGIYFIDRRPPRPAICFYDLAEHRISQVAPITKTLYHGIPAFDVSPDGRTILFSQVEKETDIVLVENFR